jgi:hypothetical protein
VSGVRYLIDAQGSPFLIQGDSAWSLIAELTDFQVDQYLDDRQAKGFNTLLVNLIEHEFSTNAPSNIYGDAPFLTLGDFSTPNNTYFDHAVSVVQKAANRDMLVLMTPAYLGYDGGSQGWYQDMSANGTTKLRAYGQYVAGKFAGLSNIIWVHGGDYTPPNLSLPNAVAEGILDMLPNSVHTYHGSPEDSARASAGAYSWLAVNNVYTYDSDVSFKVRTEYDTSQLPLFLIETAYENDNHGSTGQSLRASAYRALLEGAKGQLFGNCPMWAFSAPSVSSFCLRSSWQDALNSTGAVSMSRLWSLFSTRSWWLLEPDDNLVNNGRAARATDGSWALAYVASSVTVQLSQLVAGGSSVSVSWFNPYTGTYTPAGSYPTSGTQMFSRPTSDNGNGTDWVLLLEH